MTAILGSIEVSGFPELACLPGAKFIFLFLTLPFRDGMGWGVEGAWYAMTADVIVRSVLVSLRFWHGGWYKAFQYSVFFAPTSRFATLPRLRFLELRNFV